jgi:hypothetical protein
MQVTKLSDKELRALAVKWFKCTEELTALKAQEAALRKNILDQILPVQKEGSHTVEIENPKGVAPFKFKVVCKINRTFDQAAFPAIKKALLAMPDTVAVDSYVKYIVDLDLAAYRKMPVGAAKDLFDTLITEKPGMPSLEINFGEK